MTAFVIFFPSATFARSVLADVPKTPDMPFPCPSATSPSCHRDTPSLTLNGVLLFTSGHFLAINVV